MGLIRTVVRIALFAFRLTRTLLEFTATTVFWLGRVAYQALLVGADGARLVHRLESHGGIRCTACGETIEAEAAMECSCGYRWHGNVWGACPSRDCGASTTWLICPHCQYSVPNPWLVGKELPR